MDFGTLLKDATKTIERLGSDVSKEIGFKNSDDGVIGEVSGEGMWTGWTGASGQKSDGNVWDVDEEWQDVEGEESSPDNKENVKVCIVVRFPLGRSFS